MKNILITLATIVVVIGGWYLLSPLFINEVVDEPAPVVIERTDVREQLATDNLVVPEDRTVSPVSVVDTSLVLSEPVVQPASVSNEIVSDTVFDLVSSSTQEPLVVVVEDTQIIESETIVPTEQQLQDEIIEGEDVIMDEPMVEMEPEATVVYAGNFTAANNRYNAQGDLLVIQDGDTQTIRFENFSVSNGPDLFVTLNKGNSAKGEHVIIGGLKGNQGNQNYDVSGYDLSEYTSVSVYCRRFSSEFAVASL